MEYQERIHFLDNIPNQPSKSRTKHWTELNDHSLGTYNTSEIKFKTSTLKSSLCDYSDAYIHAKGTKIIPNTGISVAPNDTEKNHI